MFDRIVDGLNQDRKLKYKVYIPALSAHVEAIIVLLQAMKVDVPLDMKCKDKFLLQSTQITDGSTESLGDLVCALTSSWIVY